MSNYIVYLEQLEGLFAGWQEKYKLFVPQEKEGFYFLEEYSPEAEISFDYDLLYNPPKSFIFPPREDLIEFDLKTYKSKPLFTVSPQILFGLHPYDIKALNQLDQVMDMGSVDVNYRQRRDNTIIMGLTPLRVCPEAFWGSVNAFNVDFGFDLFWTKIGPATFLVEVGSKKGEELLFVNGRVDKATSAEREVARRKKQEIVSLVQKQNRLKYSWEEVPRVLEKSFDSFLWAEKSRKCLACGSCNLICPTCYCFDILDEVDDKLNKGKRYRTWDGCMLESFAKIAGGHNFRGRAAERYRHRYFRKGKYIYDMLGELGCVGCGRCVRVCTARIANPLEVFNVLWEALSYER
ncbi:MAG: Response regulator receiver protein [Desulfonauticus sp. 38_4375]|nr:MAG: Response regulator receiver protein [Desulfonauticus sp. 38_4375]